MTLSRTASALSTTTTTNTTTTVAQLTYASVASADSSVATATFHLPPEHDTQPATRAYSTVAYLRNGDVIQFQPHQ